MSSVILVIDDDEGIRELAALALESQGYTVMTAAHGGQGLSLCATIERPSAILLDMRMPVVDGWQFAAQYHQRYQDGAPIIVMTAARDAEARAREIVADAWLPKPFELSDLLSTVRRCIQERSEQ